MSARLCTYLCSAFQHVVYSEGVDYSLTRAMVRLDGLYNQGLYSEQRSFLTQIGIQCGEPIAAEDAPPHLKALCERLYRMLQEVEEEVDEEIMAASQRTPWIDRSIPIEDIDF
jgi:hypothetical protein